MSMRKPAIYAKEGTVYNAKIPDVIIANPPSQHSYQFVQTTLGTPTI
ncbi:uncharacterized protein METZ01_LOCUS403561 [marine metagenome]|uniref:Uncharacterized protein n=1 Tax=marine metagenome TaxID=408172 RepID=A0A382VW21_9ZZZZ